MGGECGILPDGLVAPPAPSPGSVSGPHWLAAARGHPLYCHRPVLILPTPPFWHIAGLAPRACERRVRGILEREGGSEFRRVNGEGCDCVEEEGALCWSQPPFQSQLAIAGTNPLAAS